MAQILLVDDEKVARAMYGDFLTGAGHQVHAVDSLAGAKEAMGRQRFDLVVTDLIFPQSDGMELIERVRVEQPTTEVLVITALEKVDAGGARDQDRRRRLPGEADSPRGALARLPPGAHHRARC